MSTRILPVMLRQSPLLAAGTLLLLGHQLGEAAVSVVVGGTIEHAVDGGGAGDLVLWLAILAATFAWLSLNYRFGSRFAARASQGIEHELRIRIVDSALRPASAGSRKTAATLVAISTSDARRVASSVRSTMNAIVAGLTIGGIAVVLGRSSILLAIIVLVAAAVVLVVLAIAGRPLQQRSDDEQHEAAVTAGLATDFAQGIRVLAGLGAGAVASSRYLRQSRIALRHTLRAGAFEGGMVGGTSLVVGLYLAGVGFVAGRLALDGRLSLADLVAALGLAQFLLGPMQTLGGFGSALARGRASAARVRSAVPATPKSRPEALPSVEAGAQDLVLRLGGDDALTARGNRLTGVAVSDPEALAALLRALSDPARRSSGLIVVPHDAALFGRTLGEALRSRTADASRIAAAVSAAALTDVVNRSPSGLARELTSGATSLSGGERQRVALARSLAAAPATLVLHEPTTAVDSATEAAIALGIRRLRAGRTTILLTTSPQVLAQCDDVVLVGSCGIEGSGSHDDLVASSAAYREAVLV